MLIRIGSLIRMGVLIRMGALIGIQLGRLLTKTHSKGGAYSEGGAYWKESTKSNHYGVLARSFPVAQWLECPTSVQKVKGSIPVGDSDFSLTHARDMLNIPSFLIIIIIIIIIIISIIIVY